MNHKKIQKQLLLYIDGDLPKEKNIFIADHLKICSECANSFELLKHEWTKAKILKEAPSPDLWFRLENRIEKSKTNSFIFNIDSIKIFFRAAITVTTVVVAVLSGSWLGRSLDGRRAANDNEIIVNENNTLREEFGMRYFEIIPPNNLADGILSIGSKSERNK